MKEYRFSIIMPIYKAEAYLSKAVESVEKQTYRNFEIILIDDGSPDKCPIICEDLKSSFDNIKVIHQKNQGVSVARNNGISIADGDIICFLDADDEWMENNLEELNIIYNKFPQIGSASTARFNQLADGTRKEISLSGQGKYLIFNDVLPKLRYIRTSTYSVKKSALLSLDYIFAPGIKRGEDTDLIVRIGCKLLHGFINLPLAVYNVGTLFNSDNVSVRTYFPFEKWYDYKYPNAYSLNIYTTGLLKTTIYRSIKQKDFVFALRILSKVRLFHYIYYKFIKRKL